MISNICVFLVIASIIATPFLLIVSLLKKGWKKGIVLQADVIKAAMDDAAHYSSDNCLREGGFGFKNQIEE